MTIAEVLQGKNISLREVAHLDSISTGGRASPSVVAPRHATAAVASVLRMVSNATVDVGVVPSVIISLTDRRKRNFGIFVC